MAKRRELKVQLYAKVDDAEQALTRVCEQIIETSERIAAMHEQQADDQPPG